MRSTRDGVPPPPVLTETDCRRVWPPRLVTVWEDAWRTAQMVGWRWPRGQDEPEFLVRYNQSRRDEEPYVWVEASRVKRR